VNKTIVKLFIAALLLTSRTSLSLAQEGAPSEGMSPEQQAIMTRMQEYSTPNEHHDVLKMFEGAWVADVKYWMDPAEEPGVSQGTSKGQMIMGGRFLEITFTGSMMEQPFEGRGLYGYDNIRKEYRNIWLDSMGTGIMVSSGQYDPATKTITEEGSMSCPITNSDRWYRGAIKIVDNDHYTYETFMKDAEGKEFRAMLITYTRQQ
jgi:hypothetical protein